MKKIISLIILLILSIQGVSAANIEEAEIVDYRVFIDDREVDIISSEYPILNYDDMTYMPLASDFVYGLGLSIEFDSETGLTIDKRNTKGRFNQKFLTGSNILSSKVDVNLYDRPVSIEGEIIDESNETYPLLVYKDIIYFPLSKTYREAFELVPYWDKDTLIIEVETLTVSELYAKVPDVHSVKDIEMLSEASVKLMVETYSGSMLVGSGFYISINGTIVTNFHVINNAKSIEVIMHDNSRYDGPISILGYDIQKDIAVIDTHQTDSLYYKMGNSYDVEENQSVYSIVSTSDSLNVLTEGRVDSVYIDWIYINDEFCYGNSGSAVIDENGYVIGVIAKKKIEGEMGLAVPINEVRALDLNHEYAFEDLFSYKAIDWKSGRYEGELVRDIPNGFGLYTYGDGNQYMGRFVNGVMEGEGVLQEDDWTFSGYFYEGLLYGYGTIETDDGTFYEGEIVESRPSGYGEITYSNGKSFEGQFSNGLLEDKNFGLKTPDEDTEFSQEDILFWIKDLMRKVFPWLS